MIEHTLVLVKPDGVARGLIGEVISRFEKRGLKIVALKLVRPTADMAAKHYTEDIAERNGEAVRKALLEFVTGETIVAMIVEGVNAIENVRKLVGATESKSAAPGTIRGDFSHVSYGYADGKGIVVKNVVHASGDPEDAKRECALWFSVDEIHDYKRSGDEHIF
jgi:nucleoside-diphosphate kinase